LMIASLGHAAVYSLARRRRWPTDLSLWRRAAVLAVFGTALPALLIFTALQYQSGGVTALLLTINPAITVLLAHFFLPDEPLTHRKTLGVALALSGAALLALRGETGLADVSRAAPIGYGLVLLANVADSSSSVYARKHMSELGAFDVASVRMFVAASVVLPLSALFVGFDLQGVDGQGYMALLYAAVIGTFVAFMLHFYNIKRFGATAAAMTAFIMPLVSGIAGVLILGERFTPFMLVGFVIIIMGVAVINRSGLQKVRVARDM
jgi:drug/metabolite transporter (DMT)-like permease